MNDLLIGYTVTLAFVCVLMALFCLYRYFLGNRMNAQANKLKSQMANIKQHFPELEEKRGQLVAQGIGDLGIDGIMNELGIDPSILKNPLVKGLVDKYAPRVLEQLAKSGGKIGNESQIEESNLL